MKEMRVVGYTSQFVDSGRSARTLTTINTDFSVRGIGGKLERSSSSYSPFPGVAAATRDIECH